MAGTAAALVATAAAGCGQVRPEGQGQSEKAVAQTEAAPVAVTEVPVVVQTETPETPAPAPETQAPETPAPVPETQAPETQAPVPETQAPETQPPAPVSLSEEEEMSQLYEFGEEEVGTKFSNDDINVRTSPTTSDSDNIVSSLDKGEEVLIIGETANWYEIYKAEDTVTGLKDLKGFVMKFFISDTYEEAMAAQPSETTAPAEAAPAEAAPAEAAPAEAAPAEAAPAEAAPAEAAPVSQASGPQVTITSDANIRSDAVENGNVVGVVNAGTTVTQIGSADGWVQIDYNGVQGYVKASMVAG